MKPKDNEDSGRACERASAAASPQPAPAPVQADASRSWPEDAQHENGNYWCECVECGHHFTGHKRRRVCKVCAQPPAPAPVQVDDALGRFGHHPDPATDFEVEVTSLQGRLFNAKHAIPDKHGVTESVAQVADAIKRAMTFRVGGVETSVRAKSILRALELDAAQPPAPGEAELPPIERDEAFDRDYIPLPGGWEVQTRGRGSTFRICDTKSGERVPVVETMLHPWLERMAREVHAAIAALAQQRVPDAVRELSRLPLPSQSASKGNAESVAQEPGAPPLAEGVSEDLLTIALEANDLCRSAHAVAERVATQYATVYAGTNFGALHEQLNASLKRQHEVLAPHRARLAARGEKGVQS